MELKAFQAHKASSQRVIHFFQNEYLIYNNQNQFNLRLSKL